MTNNSKLPNKFSVRPTPDSNYDISYDYEWDEAEGKFYTIYLGGKYYNPAYVILGWINDGDYELIVPKPKYPPSFTLVDREGGHEVDVLYDDIRKAYMLDYGDNKPITFAESEITRLLKDFYDIVEDAPTYADQLSFFHADTTQQFDMTKLPYVGTADQPLWACTRPDMAYATGATYTAEEIAKHFEAGDWEECSFAEAEPSLVTPFTVQHADHAKVGSDKTMVIDSYDGMFGTSPHYAPWSEETCKGFIKGGTWLVKSVGPQKAPEPSTSGLEVTKHQVGSVSSLTIKVGSESVVEASERLERLADAVERVNIAFESFADVFADVQHLIAPQVNATCDASREVNWDDLEIGVLRETF